MYKLDQFQIRAARAEERNLLVVAAPGSGKTTVIVNRVRYLVEEKGVNPNNIIVITFTKSAGENMKGRYLRESRSERAPFFGTFHGLFYKLLIRHLGKIDIISPSQGYKVIEKTLGTYTDEMSEDKVKEILNEISLHKNSLGDRKITDSITLDCYEKYEGFKKEKDLLDFDDLQINIYKLLQEDENILASYRRLFRFILVDEFQDCDELQLRILKLLNKENSLFCVGDEDQCIYSFRGSRPECMVEFNKIFQGEKVYLSYNYRSVQNIVETSKKLIGNNKNRNDKEILSFRKDKGEFNIVVPYNEKLQSEHIVDTIVEKHKVGVKYSDNVVLYRTNMESRSISDELIKRRIPFRFLDKEYNIFEHFICQDILAYLKLAVDPYDVGSFKRIINKPFRYVSRSNVDVVGKSIIKQNVFDDLMNNGELQSFQLKKIGDLKKEIGGLNKRSLGTAIDYVLNDLEYRENIRNYSMKFKSSMDDMEIIIEELRTIAEDFKTIHLFLAHVETVKEELASSKKNNVDSVFLSTIHGVKGLEFNNVYIIDCLEEIIPHGNTTDIEEERRLFYVAITRAINNLYIYAPKTLRGKFLSESCFLKELGFIKDVSHGYKVGDVVTHRGHGKCIIKELSGDTVTLEFNGGNLKKFSLQVLIANRLIK